MISMSPESRALSRQVLDTLPTPNANPLAFGSKELTALVSWGGRLSDKVAATYFDYYGQGLIRFNETDEPAGILPKHVTAVPRSEWDEWNVVLSHNEVYAEPVETARLERGAVVRPASGCITEHLAALTSKEVTPWLAAVHLRMLGQLPFVQMGTRGMWSTWVHGLQMDQSRVDIERERRAIVVHTPRDDMWLSPHDNRQMILHAQGAGALESVRFYADGRHEPDGLTRPLNGARESIACAQAKYLRRHFAV